MLARPSVAVVPADRRPSAFRRFPPGCGRHHNAAVTRLPHADPLPITSSSAAAAAKTPLPNPSVARAAGKAAPPRPRRATPAAVAAKPPLPNPSVARAADRAITPRPRRATPAAAFSGTGTEGPGRGGLGSGRKAPVAVNVRSVSAVRRYPPGCGRGVAVSKRPAPVGEAGAGKPTEMVSNVESKARGYDREEMLRASALDHAEFNFNGEVLNEGDGAGAQEEGGEKPWVVNGLMAVPFMPWAQHGRRKSQRPNA